MLIEQFFDAGLGHASYLCADPDAGVAFVLDPGRDVETYLTAASRLGVLITHSFETHVHNDYVSGSRALAELRPVKVVAPASAGLAYPHQGLGDGDVVPVGELAVRAVATAGHTPEHMAYLVADLRRAEDPQYLFSGGALLVGHIARVDLLGREQEESLTRAAFATLRDRILSLPDYLAVLPTHGGGSACSGTVAASRWTNLGFERRHNDAVRAAAEDFQTFRAVLAHELPAAPAYYRHVRARNGVGAASPPTAPLRQLSEDDLAREEAALLDPRPPHVFGAGHRPGALNVVGNEAFAARVGAAVPYGSRLAILTEDPDQAERLRRQLFAIGYDDVVGHAPAAPEGVRLACIEQLHAGAASERAELGDVFLDVRELAEWNRGHVPGAVHIPYADLQARLDELPRDRPVVTYCESGVRSSLAASVLAAAGRETRNMRGGFTAWERSGLEVATT
ncbi:MBL fold hydrolase [soil metagenome]